MAAIGDDVNRIRSLFDRDISEAETIGDLQGIRVRFLGKKGEVTNLLKRLRSEEHTSELQSL